MRIVCGVIACSAAMVSAAGAVTTANYQTPSDAFSRLVAAKPLPEAEVSPDGAWLLLAQFGKIPVVEQLARPLLQVASSSIDTRTGNLSAESSMATQLMLVEAATGQSWPLLAAGELISSPLWSPDSRRFVFARIETNGIELWMGEVAERRVRRLATSLASTRDARVPCTWMQDGERVLCHFVPSGRERPSEAAVDSIRPTAQDAQDSDGEGALRSRYLRNDAEAKLYEYYLSSQLAIVDASTGERRLIGEPAIHEYVAPSPDGNYILDTRIVPPYSYADRTTHFPRDFVVLDVRRSTARVLHHRALSRWGIQAAWAPRGMRHVTWNAGLPASLVFVEALDDGNPANEAAHRDRLMSRSAPFVEPPVEIMRTQGRMISVPEPRRFVEYAEFPNLVWLQDGSLWLEEIVDNSKTKRVWRVDVRRRKASLLLQFNYEDRYQDPGVPVLVNGTEHGNPVIHQNGEWIYLAGSGSTAQGDRPFLDRLNTRSGHKQRIYSSVSDSYERVVAVSGKDRFLMRHESAVIPPNYSILDVRTQTSRAITHLVNPIEELRTLEPRLVTYTRDDAVPLSGILYAPDIDQPVQGLPVVIVAYPRTYSDAGTAGRVRVAQNKYIWDLGDPLRVLTCYLVTAGYAVLWDASMPVIGGRTANDTAIPQMVSNADAAIKKLVEMGIADPSRVAIAGHSYGASMVASLLAHSRLFAAGIAFSGVYNLTQAPNGFARETRTLWQAPEIYRQLSPLFYADKISAPLLLIHGENDRNAKYTAQPVANVVSGAA